MLSGPEEKEVDDIRGQRWRGFFFAAILSLLALSVLFEWRETSPNSHSSLALQSYLMASAAFQIIGMARREARLLKILERVQRGPK